MSRIIKAIIEIDEDEFKEYVEGEGGVYDENYLWEDINGALDSLPFCVQVITYNVYGEEERNE